MCCLCSFLCSGCIACPKGRFSSSIATGVPCDLCAAGSYADVTGMRACKLCRENTYNPSAGSVNATDCVPCPEKTFSGVGSTALSSCLTKSCAPGMYTKNPDAPCVDVCPAGSFCVGIGGRLDQCPAGWWSAAKSAGCTACAWGTFGVARPTGSNSSADCLPCPVGTWSPSSGTGEHNTHTHREHEQENKKSLRMLLSHCCFCLSFSLFSCVRFCCVSHLSCRHCESG